MSVQSKWLRKASYLAGLLFCLNSTPLSAGWQTPPQSLVPEFGGRVDVATDGTKTIVVAQDTTGALDAFPFTGGAWQPSTIISSTTSRYPVIAMDATGTALVIYFDGTNINAVRYNGSTWSAPVIIGLNVNDPPEIPGLTITAIAMRGNGDGVAVWLDRNDFSTHYSFYSAALDSWTADAVIPNSTGTGEWNPFVTYSANGNVNVIWGIGGISAFQADSHIGGSWEASPTELDPNASHGALGADANGNAIITWMNQTTGDIRYATSNGGPWSAAVPKTLFPGPGNGITAIAVNPDGTAITAWANNTEGLSSTFNGTAWSTPIQFSTNGSNPILALDQNNNAIVVWSPNSEILSAQLLAGAAAWTNSLIVDQTTSAFGSLTDLNVILMNNYSVVAWLRDVGDGTSFSFGSFLFIPSTNVINGRVCKNKFANGIERVKTVTWEPFSDPSIVSYSVRRNGKLVTTIPATGPLIYRDHRRCKQTDVYTVTGVDAGGISIATETVSIR